jgi:DNA-binding NtrC family response regulator
LSAKPCVLVVDDEAFVRESLVDLLEQEGYRTLSASSGPEALKKLGSEDVSVVVTDLRMPSGDGLSLLEDTRKSGGDVPVILLTGVGTVADAVRAMKSGAFDFILKPVDPEQFVLLVARAVEQRALHAEVKLLRSTVETLRGASDMVGDSPALDAVRALIARVAGTNATVLVTGESGTGKELVAAEIHRRSDRAQRAFVSVNCAAIPESLFESEFFGHRRGAFTSALADRMGRFAEAEGGTLVLDEIGTLRAEMQAKLLRVLETGEYQVVGESRTRVADVRVIAITNEDLQARVKEGVFRTDLYYRLNVFPIRVPLLCERKEDIPALAVHFAARARGRGVAAKKGDIRISRAVSDALKAYDWPGNIREFRNVMERAVILAGAGDIDPALIQDILGAGILRSTEAPDESRGDLHIRRRVDLLERRLIQEALGKVAGKKRDAATLLGIDPKNLHYYLRKHGLLETESADVEGDASPGGGN